MYTYKHTHTHTPLDILIFPIILSLVHLNCCAFPTHCIFLKCTLSINNVSLDIKVETFTFSLLNIWKRF